MSKPLEEIHHPIPNIAVVSSRDRISKTIANQIIKIVGERVSVKGFSTEMGLPPWNNFRVILAATYNIANLIATDVPREADLIVMNRTVLKKNWEKIMQIPVGAKALLVNDEHDTAVETISLLYELGATHFSLFPYYPGAAKVPKLPLAITPNECPLVPSWVKKVIDIDDRVIDAGTIIDIMTRLGLFDEELRMRLNQHMEETIPRNLGLREILHSNSHYIYQIDYLLKWINDGVIIHDISGQVQKVNIKAETILQCEAANVIGHPYQKLFPQDTFGHNDKPMDKVFDKLVVIHNRNVIINKTALGTGERNWLGVIILREISRKESITVSKEPASKGYIATYRFEDIIGNSTAIRQVIAKAKRFAQSDFSILISGESGTGKELMAQAIHNVSPRRNGPFVAINCAAVPESLLESELFGYEEGSFTGARKGGKKGLFEQAHQGTIFLDEIGDIPLNLQVRLLRVLQEKTVMRVGATKVHSIDVRIISATNRDLSKMMKEGLFREDLYFRLNVLPIRLPPLRERKEDIIPLIEHFLQKISSKNSEGLKQQLFQKPEVVEALKKYNWPGNVRELENCLIFIFSLGSENLSLQNLPDSIKASLMSEKGYVENQDWLTPDRDNPTEQDISQAIIRLLEEHKRKNDKGGMGRRTLTKILKKQGWNVTEHHVRSELTKLALNNIVKPNRGRSGTELV